ncbi:proline-rich transmembrane protein 4 [Lampris incognitus]|uniref:proline-rich transmembrane protein 4 n=1 Tax=Lampris incognitus TaxID=2546036 RepID=UPI0024B53069|nr:proline-rich transmembrane protein 4 [Lampris incognitus]
MPSLWNLYLVFSLASPLPPHVAASTGEDVKGTPQPDPDTISQGLTKPSQSPRGPDVLPFHSTLGPKTAEILSLPLSWPTSSSEEADRQGVIGEYADMQDTSEIYSSRSEQVFPPLGTTERATEVSTSKEDARLIRASSEKKTGQEPAPRYEPAKTSTWDMHGPAQHTTQTGTGQPTLPAPQNDTFHGPEHVLLSDTPSAYRPTSETSTLSTGSRPLSGAFTPPLEKDKLGGQTTGSWVTMQGGLQKEDNLQRGNEDGMHNYTNGRLHGGNDSSKTEKDWLPAEEEQDSEGSGMFSHPDCSTDPTAKPCKTENQSCTPTYPDDFTSDESLHPATALSPPLFVPLYTDWNSALATWGLAWEAHIYGLGSIFAVFGFMSVICLLGLPLRCPPGVPYFTLLHLFLLAFGGMRAFSLLYDAYGYQDRLPPLCSLLLSELPFPCLTSAFSLAFLLLSLHSRMSLSLTTSSPGLPRPCLLFCLSLLHFGLSLGCVGLLEFLKIFPVLLLLIPQGLFVCLSILLSCSHLIYYCFVRADTKHIYRLNDSGEEGGSPEVMRPSGCPFAKVEDWGRAAGAGVGASLCLLGCGGLQLYGILHALGLGGVSDYGFQPWPWWGYQVGCRACEAGVCLGLLLIGTQPLFCHTKTSIKAMAHPRPGSWSRLSCGSPSGGPSLPLQPAEKPPVLPSNCTWSRGKQEKLVLCEVITKGKSEVLPLCSMVDPPQNGLDSVPRPSHTMISVIPLPTPPDPPYRPKCGVESQLSSLDSLGLDTDSTVDLRPPSPIDLSRSIDQALFSEALFAQSLFGPSGLHQASSSLSLNSPSRGTSKQGYSSLESAFYRTSSCGDLDQDNPLAKSRPSQQGGTLSCQGEHSPSPERWSWKQSTSGSLCQASINGSSQGLCCSPRETGTTCSNSRVNKGQNFAQNSLPRAIPHLPYQRRYRTLSLASQDSQGSGRLAGTEQLSESKQLEQDLAVQAEFINVCRQIDALSVCSDTIEL